MAVDNTERDIGKILSDIEYLKQAQQENKADIHKMRDDISLIKDILSEAKGQWKALVIFGSVCSVLGGLIVKGLALLYKW